MVVGQRSFSSSSGRLTKDFLHSTGSRSNDMHCVVIWSWKVQLTPVLEPCIIMATVSILRSALFPAGAVTRVCHESRRIGRLGISRTATAFFGDNGTPLPTSSETRIAIGRERAAGTRLGFFGFAQGRSGLRVKAQENDKSEPQQVGDNKPFYAAAEFWIQVAVVVLTFGFVDAGYSGDWSRVGALSLEAEAQLRTAAYVVVPLSAALVWVIGTRKHIQS